jgi:hypothetical protein
MKTLNGQLLGRVESRLQPELVGVPKHGGAFVHGMLSDISRFCFCFQVLVLFRDGAAWFMRCLT